MHEIRSVTVSERLVISISPSNQLRPKMQAARQWLTFLKQVFRGDRVPSHTLGYSLQEYTRRTYIWSNTEDFQKASRSAIFIHIFLILTHILQYSLLLLEVTRSPVTRDNLVEKCNNFAIAMGGAICTLRVLGDSWQRDKLTALVKSINEKVEVARQIASPELLQVHLKQYVLVSLIIVVVGIFLGLSFVLVITLYNIITADMFFKLALPYERLPYSFGWWFEMLYSDYSIVFGFVLYSQKEGMLLDCALQIAFLYRVQYDKLRSLSGTERGVKSAFIAACNELNDLQRYGRNES